MHVNETILAEAEEAFVSINEQLKETGLPVFPVKEAFTETMENPDVNTTMFKWMDDAMAVYTEFYEKEIAPRQDGTIGPHKFKIGYDKLGLIGLVNKTHLSFIHKFVNSDSPIIIG